MVEVSERANEQSGASERMSGASERANGRASGPVLQSVFLAVIDHSGHKIFTLSYKPKSKLVSGANE